MNFFLDLLSLYGFYGQSVPHLKDGVHLSYIIPQKSHKRPS